MNSRRPHSAARYLGQRRADDTGRPRSCRLGATPARARPDQERCAGRGHAERGVRVDRERAEGALCEEDRVLGELT